jgi:methanogenic corrinoid protein MtbC1
MTVEELIEALEENGDRLPVKVSRYVEKTSEEYWYTDIEVYEEDGVVLIRIDPETAKVQR